ncbi:hypothetical protein ACFL1B_05695 [Nanoarchaeota archaeon]
MFIAKTLSFYKRKDIQDAMVEHATGKEVAVRFTERFGSRPQMLTYPNDVLEFAKQKATSFHCSEELWSNPGQLKSEMTRQEQDELRSGWDFILDIDCHFFDYSKIAAHYIIKALQYCGVKSITCKFSGNKGFHIAVPWEAFPEKIRDQDANKLFPEAPKRMAEYIKFLIKEPVKEEIKKREGKDISKISKNVGIPAEKLKLTTAVGGIDLNPDPFIEIDTLLISSRHMYRMPYSFHEKSELVSVPVDIEKILEFEKEMAEPEKATVEIPFLNRDVEEGNAEGLLVRAYDFKPVLEKEAEKQEKEFELPEEAIGEECFPPCIKKILAGVGDGRKRSVFILNNFLRTCGWAPEQIQERLDEWNKKNKEPLREVYIKGQLRYGTNKKPLPPPNCNNAAYYEDIGCKCPAEICSRFKNPANYARQCSRKKGNPKKKKKV